LLGSLSSAETKRAKTTVNPITKPPPKKDSQYYGNASGSGLGLFTCSAPQEWDVFHFDAATGLITYGAVPSLCVSGGFVPPPIPTAQQVAFMDMEISFMISYDLITQLTEVPNPQHFCINAGGDRGFPVPPPSRFNPSNDTFTDNWMAAAKAANAGYTLLVASHCAGFLQWQSDVKLPDGTPYPYTAAQATAWKGGKGDVVADYVASSKAAGLPFGFYLTWCVERTCLQPASHPRANPHTLQHLHTHTHTLQELQLLVQQGQWSPAPAARGPRPAQHF
jgi:alpha-L-fucosidase